MDALTIAIFIIGILVSGYATFSLTFVGLISVLNLRTSLVILGLILLGVGGCVGYFCSMLVGLLINR